MPVEFVSNAYDCEGIEVIQCNKAIVHSSNEAELLQTICRVAVQYGGMKRSWVGLLNTDTQTLEPKVIGSADRLRRTPLRDCF